MSPIPRYHLPESERLFLARCCQELAAIGDLDSLVAACVERAPGFREGAGELAGRIRVEVRDAGAPGLLHVAGLPRAGSPQCLSLLLACLLGEPVKEHDLGPWVKEIKVDDGYVYSRPSARDAREFLLHTDLSYSTASPPLFLMHSLVNHPGDGGQTTLCSVDRLVERLAEPLRRELSAPQFIFPVPSYYPSHQAVTSAVLRQSPDGPWWLRFRQDGLRSTTWAGMSAVLELSRLMIDQMIETHVESDTVLLLDNRRWLHGRTAFLRQAGPQGARHLNQVYVQ